MSIPKLEITSDKGIKIKGVGNQITGMDNEEYEISIFGIPYPFYEAEFPTWCVLTKLTAKPRNYS